MGIYERFADFYAHGPYPGYSRRMAELVPLTLRKLDVHAKTILDVACGEGTFAVAMAKQGFDVTGLDLSPHMLGIARRRADQESLGVRLVLGDMRSLGFGSRFDLVTCWYDSLNYLLHGREILAAFTGISEALNPGGVFIFDMNTIYGLAVLWRSHPFFVAQDAPDIFDVHINSYDAETKTATKRIVGFARQGGIWDRIDEEHVERGYSLEEIRTCLADSGLEEIACWASLENWTAPGPETGRVWFVAKRSAT